MPDQQKFASAGPVRGFTVVHKPQNKRDHDFQNINHKTKETLLRFSKFGGPEDKATSTSWLNTTCRLHARTKCGKTAFWNSVNMSSL